MTVSAYPIPQYRVTRYTSIATPVTTYYVLETSTDSGVTWAPLEDSSAAYAGTLGVVAFTTQAAATTEKTNRDAKAKKDPLNLTNWTTVVVVPP